VAVTSGLNFIGNAGNSGKLLNKRATRQAQYQGSRYTPTRSETDHFRLFRGVRDLSDLPSTGVVMLPRRERSKRVKCS
jgi:hypothetical protein